METTKIYRTSNYKQFKVLLGNRAVSELRVKKIIDSIMTVGYVISPICVNEKMEVIDGQGRLEALKRLGMPVDYYVAKGAGIEECISMNINQTNWKLTDYIDSYAERGDVAYKYLQQAMKAYKGISVRVILAAFTGLSGTGSSGENLVKTGAFSCTEDEYNETIKCLEYLFRFKDIVQRIGGRTEMYYIALRFCYMCRMKKNNCFMMRCYIMLFPSRRLEEAITSPQIFMQKLERRQARLPQGCMRRGEG